MHKTRQKSNLNLSDFFKQLVLPGFDGIPFSHVIELIIVGFKKGSFVTRASSIGFNLLMALLPTIIFTFTLIPFIPIPNFQTELVRIIESILPSNVYTLLESTIIDVATTRSTRLLFFMFFATIIFSSNGFHAILHAFTVSEHSFETRSWINQRKIAILLFIGIVLLICLAGLFILFGKLFITQLVELNVISRSIVAYLFSILNWLIISLLFLTAISSLYYFAPAKKGDYRFFSPGAITSTVLFIASSLGFSAYVNNIGLYNILYGWLGTILVILAWSYINAIALLIGFELNVSIIDAKKYM